MTRTVGIAALCAGAIVAGLMYVIFAQEPAPSAEGDDARAWLLALEDRLDELERRIDDRFAARDRPGAAPAAVERDAGRPPDAGVPEAPPVEESDRLRAAIDDLAMRIRALEEDPITRGYAFLESESAELRSEGIRTLRRLARFDPAAREAIRAMLDDPSARVRGEALHALADLRDKESLPRMLGFLGEEDAGMRHDAVQALVQLGMPEAGADVARMLADPSERVRRAAADALGRLKSQDGAAALMQALGDPNEDVRGEAIASLGEIGAVEATGRLRELYVQDEGRHRIRIVRALQALGDDGPFKAEVARLSDVALKHENARERARALQTLSWFARNEAKDVFAKARNDPDERVRSEAGRASRRP